MAKTGPEIVLVRHGETEWSANGRHTGVTDVPLTDAGRRQGELLGRRLAGRRFARVLSSPRTRARETCRLAGLDAAVEIRDDLSEWDYGAYEGRTTADIRAEAADWYLFSAGAPGGESPADVGVRADRVIEELHSLEDDAVLFSHGHFLRVLAARWLGMPPEAGGRLALQTATVSVLGWEREVSVVWLWNGGAHLAAETT